jgi:hypothetical protein
MLGDDIADRLCRLKELRKEAKEAEKKAVSTRDRCRDATISFHLDTKAARDEIGDKIAVSVYRQGQFVERFKRTRDGYDEDIASLQAKRALLQGTMERRVEKMEQQRAELETEKAEFEALLLDNTELPDSSASPASPAMTARTYQEEARGASPSSTTRSSSPGYRFEWPASFQGESRTPSPASTEDERERERERERTRACEND